MQSANIYKFFSFTANDNNAKSISMEEFTLTKLYYRLTNLLISDFLGKCNKVYNLQLTKSRKRSFKLLISEFLSLLAYSTLIKNKTIYFGDQQIRDVFDQSPKFSEELTVIYKNSGN